MLTEISPNNPLILPLFDRAVPNHPMLFSTLAGNNPGRAFVDDANQPAQCFVRTGDGLNFFSQLASQAFFDESLAFSRELGHVLIVWRANAWQIEIPKADKLLQRSEFTDFDPVSPAFTRLAASPLREGLAFQTINRDLLEACEWKGEIESFCGSLENFLAHGFGVCLLQSQEIIAEAYAPFVAPGAVEIGAVTREAQRGKGYAALTCARLIQTCLDRQLKPYWSCDADNLPSVNLAVKLGFLNQQAYEIQIYRGTPS